MMEERKDKPTKKWLTDQLNFLQGEIIKSQMVLHQNQGAYNLVKGMLEKGVYQDEPAEKSEE